MKFSFRSVALLLLLSLAVPAFAQQWQEIHSPNFTFVTDGNLAQGRDAVARFEQMRALFGALFKRTKVTVPVPLTIIGFRSSRELRDNGPLFGGKPVELTGFYQPGEDRNFIALDLSNEDSYQTVFHEYAHVLLNANYPRTQPWFDEGFAEYYSSMKIGKTQAEIGGAPSSAGIFGETQNLMPIATLFSVARNSKTYNESGDRRSMFYAQSWLVMHWIFDNQKLADVGRYFDGIMNRKMAVPDAIRYGFGMDPKELDAVLAAYLRSGRGNIIRINLPLTIDPNNYTAKKLSDPQAGAVVADLRLHMTDRREEAIGEFEQILKTDPDSEVAHRALAFAYISKHDLDRARPHLQRAAELNSQDARVHYYNAVLLNRGSQESAENDQAAQQMLYELQKAVDLDPNYAAAWHLLALMQMNRQHGEEALASIKRAIALSPRNDEYRLMLAQMLVANNQFSDGKALLSLLQSSSDASVANQATQALANMDATIAQRQRWSEQGLTGYKDLTDPRWKPKEGQKLNGDEEKPQTAATPDTRKIEYLKGTLVSVSCADAGATLMVSASGRTWRFKTEDYKKVILIGADAFNCSWKNVKASVNYKSSGAGQGDLVSLEVD